MSRFRILAPLGQKSLASLIILDAPGCRIRVREHLGDTVILIGATAARRYPGMAVAG